MAFPSSNVAAQQPYTPTGVPTVNDYCNFAEVSQAILDAAEQYVATNHPDAIQLLGATKTYNCHGFAWWMQEEGGGVPVWIGGCPNKPFEGPAPFLDPRNYRSVWTWDEATKIHYLEPTHQTGPPGVYCGTHSGVTDPAGPSGWIISKWGLGPLVNHQVEDVPPSYFDHYAYYVRNDDPGADIMGFTVVNGEASWQMEAEYKTKELFIEGRNDVDQEWNRLSVEVTKKFGLNRVSVAGSGYKQFRLVELETTGKRLIHGRATATTAPASEINYVAKQKPARSEQEARAAFEAVKAEYIRSGVRKVPAPPERATPSPVMIIYTTDGLLNAVESSIAHFWNVHLHATQVKSVSSFDGWSPAGGHAVDPDAARASLHADIVAESQTTQYFLLVGDASDWQQFSVPWPTPEWEAIKQDRINITGYPPGGEPWKDLIPTWYTWDPLNRDEGNMSYFNPYWFSDQPYADVTGDGVPDVVVSRLPVTTATQVWDYATKLWDPDNSTWEAGKVGVLIGDEPYGNDDDERALAAAQNVQASLPSWVDQEVLYRSQVVFSGEQNTMPANLINTEEPELIVQLSSISARYRPGYFFDKCVSVNTWDMNMINTNQPMVFLSGSCATADFTRVDSPNYDDCTAHEFLFEPQKGATAWIGPGAGTWQDGNEAFLTEMVKELYETPNRRIGLAFLQAVRDVITDNPGVETIANTAKSYHLLGDPLLTFGFDAPPPPPPPGGGCPHVFVETESGFERDNTILSLVAGESAGNPAANVRDSYVLQCEPMVRGGKYRFEIREFENEHTYLDQLELLAVDHAEDTNVSVLDDGTIVVHRDHILPTSATTGSGDDVLVELKDVGGAVFKGEAGDEVTLHYVIPRHASLGFVLRAGEKEDVLEPEFSSGAGIEALLRVPGSEEFVSMGSFMPREYLAPDARLITEHLAANGISSGAFEVKLIWHSSHELDFAGIMVPVTFNPLVVESRASSIQHTRSPVSLSQLADTDGSFVELLPGQRVALEFDALPEVVSGNRTFIMRADGHYVKSPAGDSLPTKFALRGNYPNPFNPTTTIKFDLPSRSFVALNVYSVKGALVATLAGESMPAGTHSLTWDGRDRQGDSVSSGVYFYRLKTSFGTETRKMTLMK